MHSYGPKFVTIRTTQIMFTHAAPFETPVDVSKTYEAFLEPFCQFETSSKTKNVMFCEASHSSIQTARRLSGLECKLQPDLPPHRPARDLDLRWFLYPRPETLNFYSNTSYIISSKPQNAIDPHLTALHAVLSFRSPLSFKLGGEFGYARACEALKLHRGLQDGM